jgi:hypothetical protein
MSLPLENFTGEAEMLLQLVTRYLARFIRRLRRRRIRKMREQRQLSKSYRKHKMAVARRTAA